MTARDYHIKDELIICRYRQGIRLMNPKTLPLVMEYLTVENMLKMPFMVYFFDKNSLTRKINTSVADAFNMLSLTDPIGKTIRYFAEKESAEMSLSNNTQVITSGNLLIKDESYNLFDGKELKSLSFKFPWYNAEDKIIGIFGYTFINDYQCSITLADSFNQLIKTGLFPQTMHPVQDAIFTNNILTSREKEVLYYLCKIKTAKEIACLMNISNRTVEYYIDTMKTKLHCHTKSELIKKVQIAASFSKISA